MTTDRIVNESIISVYQPLGNIIIWTTDLQNVDIINICPLSLTKLLVSLFIFFFFFFCKQYPTASAIYPFTLRMDKTCAKGLKHSTI